MEDGWGGHDLCPLPPSPEQTRASTGQPAFTEGLLRAGHLRLHFTRISSFCPHTRVRMAVFMDKRGRGALNGKLAQGYTAQK